MGAAHLLTNDCPICYTEFDTRKELRDHLATEHDRDELVEGILMLLQEYEEGDD